MEFQNLPLLLSLSFVGSREVTLKTVVVSFWSTAVPESVGLGPSSPSTACWTEWPPRNLTSMSISSSTTWGRGVCSWYRLWWVEWYYFESPRGVSDGWRMSTPVFVALPPSVWITPLYQSSISLSRKLSSPGHLSLSISDQPVYITIHCRLWKPPTL